MAAIRTCYICEKPSLAREVAAALGEHTGSELRKAEGHIVVGDDVVTWFFGHMFELAEPKAYGPKWASFGDISSLPIVIADDEWQLVVPEDKKAQVGIVRGLAKKATVLVNCGDAGREGQLLVDEAIGEFGIDPFGSNVQRLWCQSVTRKDLLDAIRTAQPNRSKEGLYNAALARSRADFQHGMTYSRLFTILARRGGADVTVSVGRVQTPTLRLVVDRDRERSHFKPVAHYLPSVTFVHPNGTFSATWNIPPDADGTDSEGRLVDRNAALAVCAKVDGKSGRLLDYKSEPKVVSPPLPYSLETLQSDCGRKLKLTAKETLGIAQSLYEKKITSYPRSDSEYLPPVILEGEAPGIIAQLRGVASLSQAASGADLSLKSAAWNASKVTDHYAIIPTGEVTSRQIEALEGAERAVFDLVAKAFIAQFYPGHRYRAISTTVGCEGEKFSATGRLLLDSGWHVVYGKVAEDEDDDGEATPTLPEMARDDAVTAKSATLLDRVTTPPKAFSDDRLIKAMANAHLFETNPDVRRRLKEGDGIGRPATRADIIETLLRRKFLVRKGKTGLESTELGRSVVDVLPEELKSVGMTALWETAMERIEKGDITTSEFLGKQAEDISRRVMEFRSGSVAVKGVATVKPLPGHGKTCPKCGTGTMFTKQFKSKKTGKTITALSCSNYPACDNMEFADTTPPIAGHGKACTKCEVGQMNTRTIAMRDGSKQVVLACSNYPTCRNIEFQDSGKKAPPQTGPDLPGTGKACPKCGNGKLVTRSFTSKKDGKPFSMLKCDQWPKCDHGEFVDKKTKPSA